VVESPLVRGPNATSNDVNQFSLEEVERNIDVMDHEICHDVDVDYPAHGVEPMRLYCDGRFTTREDLVQLQDRWIEALGVPDGENGVAVLRCFIIERQSFSLRASGFSTRQ